MIEILIILKIKIINKIKNNQMIIIIEIEIKINKNHMN